MFTILVAINSKYSVKNNYLLKKYSISALSAHCDCQAAPLSATALSGLFSVSYSAVRLPTVSYSAVRLPTVSYRAVKGPRSRVVQWT